MSMLLLMGNKGIVGCTGLIPEDWKIVFEPKGEKAIIDIRILLATYMYVATLCQFNSC